MSRQIKKVVTLSDIHIGTQINNNGIACWFNEKYHGPPLNSIFEYVVQNKDTIDELVILGDLFDTWTYAPDVKPPSVLDIINDNKTIFGVGTALDKAVTAMNGNVTFLTGNHDMNVTQLDLDEIPLSNNHKIKLHEDGGALGNDRYMIDDTLFTHGHVYTIFNAPPFERNAPAKTPKVPLGHFVTRLIAYYIKNQHPQVPAWEVVGNGAPGKRQLLFSKAFFPALKFVATVFNPLKKYSFGKNTVSDFLDLWINATGFSKLKPEDQTFTMQDGTIMTVNDVKNEYKDLFTDWLNLHSHEYVIKSIYTDGAARSMSWFTQQDALTLGAKMVVTGHTHWGTNGVNAYAEDVNCGFDCVPKGDKSIFSFAEIDDIGIKPHEGIRFPKSKVFEVVEENGVYIPKIAPNVPKGDIVFKPLEGFPFPQPHDHSVYVTIHNTYDSDIELQEHSVSYGNWRISPPKTISANSKGGFWVQDSKAGSTGYVSYKTPEGIIKLDFSCPWIQSASPNIAKFSGPNIGTHVAYQTKVGDGKWTYLIQPPKGNPLSIDAWFGHY